MAEEELEQQEDLESRIRCLNESYRKYVRKWITEKRLARKEEPEFRIRRVDMEPNEENLASMLIQNWIGRNKDLRDLIDLLHRIDGPYTLFLDGAWGTGKTIFAKQLELVLKKLNQQLTSGDEAESFFKFLWGFEGLRGEEIVPVYYNAWKNDYWPHPLPSLGAALADAAKEKFDPKSDSPSSKAVLGILGKLGKVLGPMGGALEVASSIAGDLLGQRILEAYQRETDLREAVGELVEIVKREQGNRVLLIIDELDRCKPSFALEMLEATKTLFDHDDVTVLYVLNQEALACMVEKEYGTGVTGSEYLRKFYDYSFGLPEADADRAIFAVGGSFGSLELGKPFRPLSPNAYGAFDYVCSLLRVQFAMTMRDSNRFASLMIPVVAWFKERSEERFKGRRWVLGAMCGVIVPLLHAVKLMNPNDYKVIRANRDGAKLWSYLQANEELVTVFAELLDAPQRHGKRLSVSELGERFCQASCQVLWNDWNDTDREEAIAFLQSLQSDKLEGLDSLRALLS